MSRGSSEFEAAEGAGGGCRAPPGRVVAKVIRTRSRGWRWRGGRAPPGRVASGLMAERSGSRSFQQVRPRGRYPISSPHFRHLPNATRAAPSNWRDRVVAKVIRTRRLGWRWRAGRPRRPASHPYQLPSATKAARFGSRDRIVAKQIRVRSRGWRWRGGRAPPARAASVSSAVGNESRTARVASPCRREAHPNSKPQMALAGTSATSRPRRIRVNCRTQRKPYRSANATASRSAGKRSQ